MHFVLFGFFYKVILEEPFQCKLLSHHALIGEFLVQESGEGAHRNPRRAFPL